MMLRQAVGLLSISLLVAGATACSSSNGGAKGSGGEVSSGGTVGSGGTVASGGKPGDGGAVGSGGKSGAGGALGSGGGSGSGGAITDAAPPVSTSGCGQALPAACNNTTTGPCTLDVNGKTRQYFVVLPTSYDNTSPAPVVFTYHGRGGTASSLLPTGSPYGGGYALYGVQSGLPNAIYVVPQGLDSGSEAGTDYGWPNTGGQDINFVKAMITWLETSLCVDKSRYFSDGMSYGGMMSETIACQMPDVFRAIGSMSGSLFGSTRSCVAKPIAAWITHGDADTTVAISGDQTARDLIVADNGCSATNTSTVDVVDTARIGDAGAIEQGRAHVRGIRHHEDDEVGLLRDLLAVGARLATCAGQGMGHRRMAVQVHLMSGLDQVAGHGRAHDAESHKSDLAHRSSHMSELQLP